VEGLGQWVGSRLAPQMIPATLPALAPLESVSTALHGEPDGGGEVAVAPQESA